MKIAIVINALLPAIKYGGTERVAYSLGSALAAMGHSVVFIARQGSFSPFGTVIPIDPAVPVASLIPDDVDVVHFNNVAQTDRLTKPYIVTIHGNGIPAQNIDPNSVFVSADHARRHGCQAWVHNGLDWDMYPKPDLTLRRDTFHFLGNGAWKVKNLRGAIDVAKRAKVSLDVMGASRINFKMGFRLTLSPRVHFHGMVDNSAKARICQRSRGLLFPVRWHEPFGLALIESMYYGAPVFGTPYGALPEIVNSQVGFLSSSAEQLALAMCESDFSPRICHDYAAVRFSAAAMANAYIQLYQKVIDGEPLNPVIAPQCNPNARNLQFV